MKTLILVMGLMALLGGCKREEPQPTKTILNMKVINEAREVLPWLEVGLSGSTGSYFGGTRKDSVFGILKTDIKGEIKYEALIDKKWRIQAIPFGYLTSPSTLPI